MVDSTTIPTICTVSSNGEQGHSAALRQRGRFQIFSWTLFDFANTGFSVMIVTLGYALYFRQVVAQSDFHWGLAVSISMLLCAVLAPPLGAAADATNGRKQFLLAFTLLSVVSTALLYFVEPGMVLLGMFLFILANVGFESGIVFYDALLPFLTSSRAVGRVSGYGYAMGYLGSLAILSICFPLIKGGLIPENLPNYRLAFPVTAVFFLTFSLPLFLFVREERSNRRIRTGYLRLGFRRAWRTLKSLPKLPRLQTFLLAFFLYNDAILTIISFSAIIAQVRFGFTTEEVIVFFLTVQTAAIAGSVVLGILTDKFGPKRIIQFSLLVWIAIVVAVLFIATKGAFYGVGFLAGAFIGGTQSASRSLMAMLTPAERSAEFFGFFDGFFGKASAIIGPFLFGLLSDVFHQDVAIASLIFFFLAGFLLISRISFRLQ